MTVFGFFVMGMLAVRTYTDSMPLSETVVGQDGQAVYTADDVTADQQIFPQHHARLRCPRAAGAGVSSSAGR